MTLRKVVLPLDGSDLSRQVLPHVRQLFAPDGTMLVLLHAVRPREGVMGSALWWAAADLPQPVYVADAATLVEAHAEIDPAWSDLYTVLRDRFGDDVAALSEAGYSVALAVRFGDPAAEIVAFAEENGADIIVMATHGRGGVRRLLLGSVAEEVLRHTPVPLLLVRPS